MNVPTIVSIVLIPVTVLNAIAVCKLDSTINKQSKDLELLSAMVARQHDLNPSRYKANSGSIIVPRNIRVNEVAFDQSGNSTVTFTDLTVKPKSTFTQRGCQNLSLFVDKTLTVSYNIKSSTYAISCKYTRGLKNEK